MTDNANRPIPPWSADNPLPWSEGTGRFGLYCSRISKQVIMKQRELPERKLTAMLPLVVLPEETNPVAGDMILILTAPVRGIPFTIAKVELAKLADLTDDHYEELGVDKAAYLAAWDECNEKHPAAGNPDLMLLWLLWFTGSVKP